MSPPLEPDSLLEDTIPQLMEVDQQQQRSPPAGATTAARSVELEGLGQEDVPSPGRLDDFDFEGSLDAITTACPAAEGNVVYSSPSKEGGGEGKAGSAAAVAGAEEQEVRSRFFFGICTLGLPVVLACGARVFQIRDRHVAIALWVLVPTACACEKQRGRE